LTDSVRVGVKFVRVSSGFLLDPDGLREAAGWGSPAVKSKSVRVRPGI